jgi:hypothetical protein
MPFNKYLRFIETFFHFFVLLEKLNQRQALKLCDSLSS